MICCYWCVRLLKPSMSQGLLGLLAKAEVYRQHNGKMSIAAETSKSSGNTSLIGRSWKWAFEIRRQDLTSWSSTSTRGSGVQHLRPARKGQLARVGAESRERSAP